MNGFSKGDVVDIRLKSGACYAGVELFAIETKRLLFFKDSLSAPTIVQVADIALIRRVEL